MTSGTLWWTGFLISFLVFLALALGLGWWLTRWGARHIDRMHEGERDEKEE